MLGEFSHIFRFGSGRVLSLPRAVLSLVPEDANLLAQVQSIGTGKEYFVHGTGHMRIAVSGRE